MRLFSSYLGIVKPSKLHADGMCGCGFIGETPPVFSDTAKANGF